MGGGGCALAPSCHLPGLFVVEMFETDHILYEYDEFTKIK